ncbi:GNAT family N-acetyltransferase [Alkalicoccobacillus porphyridii]|uniref:GNAT family N-acetyltransferase n=2 Tax=Alkalicoccobacillus porphyridii TaxID=2597270 RepID=A0A554A1J7_9BACI|nr:GNAT family N-acetyltransferase [Alkalicoccobacillus porphyridii]
MNYYNDGKLVIRPLIESDIPKLVEGFAAQKWQKPRELFEEYYRRQKRNEQKMILAEKNGEVAGYVTLLPSANPGPYAAQNFPEVVDFNVLIKYQRSGIGTKLMDVAEELATSYNRYVTLAVGLHYGYGAVQKMYVKRGYIPDGSGVWYKDQQLEQYAPCVNDDDLILYFIKALY